MFYINILDFIIMKKTFVKFFNETFGELWNYFFKFSKPLFAFYIPIIIVHVFLIFHITYSPIFHFKSHAKNQIMVSPNKKVLLLHKELLRTVGRKCQSRPIVTVVCQPGILVISVNDFQYLFLLGITIYSRYTFDISIINTIIYAIIC